MYYKPNETDSNNLAEFKLSCEMASKTNTILWIGGDFNMPKIDWTNMTPTPDCKSPTLYQEFINIIYENNITQMNHLPTRENNILDLFFTSNPTLVNRTSIFPGC